MPLTLTLLPEALSICRFPPSQPVSLVWFQQSFCSVTKTAEELSVVTVTGAIDAADPDPTFRSHTVSQGWRAMVVEGPLDFSLTGVLAALASPLAQAGIPIFVVSTFDTDYLLVKETALEQAKGVLGSVGHQVRLPL